jgi:hypothetical protein
LENPPLVRGALYWRTRSSSESCSGSSVPLLFVKVMHFIARRQTSHRISLIPRERYIVASSRSPGTIANHQARSFSRLPRKIRSADAIQEECRSNVFPWDSTSIILVRGAEWDEGLMCQMIDMGSKISRRYRCCHGENVCRQNLPP